MTIKSYQKGAREVSVIDRTTHYVITDNEDPETCHIKYISQVTASDKFNEIVETIESKEKVNDAKA